MIKILTTWRKHITIFRLLYWAVAIATFRHSAIGFATLEHGNVLLGGLAALAVDIGMLLSAEKLQKRPSVWLVLGLLVSAGISVYSQFLHAVTNATAIAVAPGATWLGEIAIQTINYRIIIIPIALPLLVVLYSFAAKVSEIVESVSKTQPVTNPLQISTTATKKEQALALLELHPRLDASTLSEKVGCSPTTAYNAIREFSGNGSKPKERIAA